MSPMKMFGHVTFTYFSFGKEGRRIAYKRFKASGVHGREPLSCYWQSPKTSLLDATGEMCPRICKQDLATHLGLASSP